MCRIEQPPGLKGSLKGIQYYVNEKPGELNEKIENQIHEGDIIWLSPLKEDNYAEYRDECFIDLLGLNRYQTIGPGMVLNGIFLLKVYLPQQSHTRSTSQVLPTEYYHVISHNRLCGTGI